MQQPDWSECYNHGTNNDSTVSAKRSVPSRLCEWKCVHNNYEHISIHVIDEDRHGK